MSASCTVDSLWAMTMQVLSLLALSRASCTICNIAFTPTWYKRNCYLYVRWVVKFVHYKSNNMIYLLQFNNFVVLPSNASIQLCVSICTLLFHCEVNNRYNFYWFQFRYTLHVDIIRFKNLYNDWNWNIFKNRAFFLVCREFRTEVLITLEMFSNFNLQSNQRIIKPIYWLSWKVFYHLSQSCSEVQNFQWEKHKLASKRYNGWFFWG